MPVDKFGRSNNKVDADGVSLSFIINQLQRKSNEIESLRKIVNLQKDQLSDLANSEASLRSSLNLMKKHYITIWAEEKGGLTLVIESSLSVMA